MVAKYRNYGLIQAAVALGLSVLLIYLCRKHSYRMSSNMGALCILLSFGAWAMWMVTSFSFARAKGYSRDLTGGLFLILAILGFCIPILPAFFPIFIIFALEDKAKTRRRH